jgi:VanZ family protein
MTGDRQHDRSSAVLLGAVWVILIVYASLFPFVGWHWPPGARLVDLLRLPWPRYFIAFDIASNLLGYLPLGFLLTLAVAPPGQTWPRAMAVAVVAAALLSGAMEVAQNLLPQRVSSSLDWLLNVAGAALGALVAWSCHLLGWLRRWRAVRERWFDRGSGGAFALLLLWPTALLFPTPVPLGVGQIGGPLRDLLLDWLQGVSWAQPVSAWLAAATAPQAALAPLNEGLAVALGLLSPCLLSYAASRPGWRRVGLALAVAVVAVATTTLATALNFGPDHALAWRTPGINAAAALALGLALALSWAGMRLAAALALVSLTGLLLLVHQAPNDPYFAQSLQGWEQGRFIRFHGLARWIGWLWPYAAMAWLLDRLASTER